MPAQRRLRMLLLAVLATVIFILYLTSDARRVQNQRFYQQTVEALDSQAARKLEQDDEGVFKKLRPGVGEERVIAVERQKYDDNKSEGKTGGSDGVIEGDIEVTDNRKSNEVPIAGGRRKPRPGAGDAPPQQKDSEKEEDPEVEAELNSILKRSPIIIFSKSYCPYSTKAKRILLEEYTIVPSPFVVELDLHPLGPKLQDCLAKNTGRRTVPNVLVNGRSIGGGDDMEALDSAGELSSKIKDYAGKRVMEITRKEREKDEEKAL